MAFEQMSIDDVIHALDPDVRWIDPDQEIAVEAIGYSGRDLWQRLADLPSVFHGGHLGYPVHEFIWRLNVEGNLQIVWGGMTANGEVHMKVIDENTAGPFTPWSPH